MCRLIERLFALVPVTAFRLWLLRVHVEGCPKCRTYFEPEADLRTASSPPDWIRSEESLWPRVRDGIRTRTANPKCRTARTGRPMRWAVPAAVTGLLMAFVVGLLLFRPAPVSENGARVSVIRAETNGRKASTYLFQTRQASYIWIGGEEHDEHD